MEKNDKPRTSEPVTEKTFNPNRAQRRAGTKAFMKTDTKRTRALASNHPPKVVDRRKLMRQPALP